jgi:hypothetical protein
VTTVTGAFCQAAEVAYHRVRHAQPRAARGVSEVTGVWAIMTVVTIFFGLPAILGTLIASVHGSPRILRGWVTFMVASLAVELVLTAIVMAIT